MSYRLSIVLVVALVSPAARAAVINVPGDFPTIQTAVAAANTGDEVVVAPGTYVNPVSIPKTITLRSSGGPEVTTIQGSGTFPVVLLNSPSANPVIQGFTITGGTQVNLTFGGGISISNFGANPTIVDCIFTDNVANQDQGGGGIGGAFNSNCTVIGCTFSNNVADNGGAINMVSATISDCTFQGNSTTQFAPRVGGAIRLVSGTIDDCTFTGNTATSHGGAVHAAGNITVTNCTFESNMAAGSGGGARLESGADMTGCTFSGNSAATGGGLSMLGGEVTDCTFDANTSTGVGGALYVTGTSPLITQCTFRANTAGTTGGGMYVGSGVTATLIDGIFCQNMPNAYFSNGVLMASGLVIATEGTDCDEALIAFGGCCPPAGTCVVTTQSNCIAAGGVYQGEGVTCDIAACPEACTGDLNGDLAVNVTDLLGVLGAWGVCP